MRGFTGRPGRRSLSGALVGTVAVGVVAIAALAPALPVRGYDLHDGSVWVTNSERLQMGRLNREIGEVGSTLLSSEPSFDVAQDGADVVAVQGSGMQRLDVAQVRLGGVAELPAGAQVQVGGGTLAVSAEDGRVWVLRVADAERFSADAPPTLEAGPGAATAVGRDGRAHVVSSEQASLSSVTAQGQVRTRELPRAAVAAAGPAGAGAGAGDRPRRVGVTAVGDDPVVLLDGTLVLPDGDTVELVQDDVVVQLPSGPADRVVLSTRTGLAAVDLADGSIRTLSSGGARPVAPVVVGSCAHGAWHEPATYALTCEGDEQPREPLELGTVGDLRFRVNRDVVVLNDTRTGEVWTEDRRLDVADEWPQQESTSEEGETEDDRVEFVDRPTERSDQNTPPDAVDDELGVRPGRVGLLPVLDNDVDPDGDVLVARAETTTVAFPDGSRASVSQAPRGLQVDVPAEARGTVSFTYTADDGRGGTDSATVTVEAVPPERNRAPEQVSSRSPVVETGHSVSYATLADWRDPDGDDLVLQSAAPGTGTVPGDTVTFRPDGAVTYTDSGASAGRKGVALVVSDGALSTEGELGIEVLPAGPVAPVANPDAVTAVVGRPVVVSPLANDTDANDDPLRLTGVTGAGPVTGVVDPARGEVELTAAAAGTWYVDYTVNDGALEARGLIRVDAVEPAENRPPVAVNDTALMVEGTAMVDALANDSDPDGDVIGIRSATAAPGSGLSVAVVDNRILEITAPGGLQQPGSVTYVLSDGRAQTRGTVAVLPVDPASVDLPPVAVADEAVVRSGDVVTVDVLANDTDPEGEPLTVSSVQVLDGGGEAFAGAGGVRYVPAPLAPGAPAQLATLRYTIVDAAGQQAAADVTITVNPPGGQNRPPQARAVQARVYAGGTTRIPIPVTGVDPDGDSVSVVGILTPPALGRVSATGPDWIDVEAFAVPGNDTFTYELTDPYGARAGGQVAIAVLERPDVNQPPLARQDLLSVRPGTTVTADVLANDVDPDGDPLTLGGSDTLIVPAGVDARVQGSRIVVDVPAGLDADAAIGYRIEDGRGGTADGTLLLRPDARASLPPVAVDDEVTVAALAAGDGTASIDVLANDSDPDGPGPALTVTSVVASPGGPTATQEGGVLSVTAAAVAGVIRYTVADADGNEATAVVRVPAWTPGAGAPPALRSGLAPITVAAGESVTIPLSQVVADPDGDTVRLASVDTVSATSHDGSALIVDERTLRYAPATGYSGPAALTAQVTDAAPGAVPAADHVVTVTVPLEVLGSQNSPPTLRPSPVTVGAGETATVDARPWVADPDPGEAAAAALAVVSAGAGLQASFAGDTLRITAEAGSAGSTSQVVISADDGTNAPVTAAVPITIASSTAPLAVAVPDTVTAEPGQSVSVDVLANDSNPFPGTGLRLLSAAVTSTAGQATTSGDTVLVTPPAGFVGDVLVAYRVGDATADPAREVTGRLTVTYRGAPGATGVPELVSAGDGTLTYTWSAAVDNGSPIARYVLTVETQDGSGPARSLDCPTTTCTVTGLVNGTSYLASVAAVNGIGTGPASGRAGPHRPEAPPVTYGMVPGAAPSASAQGAADVAVTWDSVSTASPPQWRLESDAAAAAVTVGGRSHTYTGLQPGTYRFRVAPLDAAGNQAGDWSAYSAPVTVAAPLAVPAAPAAPAAVDASNTTGARISFSWSPPSDDGGSPITAYQLFQNSPAGPQGLAILTPSTRSYVADVQAGVSYQFAVQAVNAVGNSPLSAWSSPLAVTGPQVRSELAVGQGLASGERLTSPNGRYTLVMQTDGNLVEYDGNSVIWNSGTKEQGSTLGSSPGGQFFIANTAGQPRWTSWTEGYGAASMRLQDDGNVVVVGSDGRVIIDKSRWQREGLDPTMNVGETFQAGARLTSMNGRYTLTLQGDGNLVLADNGTAIWSSGTEGNPGAILRAETNGNFVMYASDGTTRLWATDTQADFADLHVATTGKLQVLAPPSEAILWQRP